LTFKIPIVGTLYHRYAMYIFGVMGEDGELYGRKKGSVSEFFSFFIGIFFDGSSLFTVESNPCLSSIV